MVPKAGFKPARVSLSPPSDCEVNCEVDPAYHFRKDTNAGGTGFPVPPSLSGSSLFLPIPFGAFWPVSKSRVRKDMSVRPPPPPDGKGMMTVANLIRGRYHMGTTATE